MGIGELQTIATVSAFIAFVGVAWWAYSPKNKKRFEEDAQLALDDEDIDGAPDAVIGATELDALVAYLQQLGTAMEGQR